MSTLHTFHCYLVTIDCLRFSILLSTKQVISETFFPDDLLAKYRKTRSNTTKANTYL